MDLFYTYINNFSGKDKNEKQHIAGRYIVEYAAKNIYKIENSEIEIINKKPAFKHSDIKFSISHSGNIAAVCFDINPVGFDIEQITIRDFVKIAKRMNFKLKNNSPEEFYSCWTKYEAAIKLNQKVNYSLSKKFKDNYIISIASSVKFNEDINIKEII